MKHRDTTYRLALTTKDFKACHALLEKQGMETPRLSWPTVMAERDGRVVGVLGRFRSDAAVIAGPLAVDASVKRPLITVLRLVEAWELVVWRAGVREYFFGVDPLRHKAWLQLLDKAGLEPYSQDDGWVWFKRELKEDGRGH